jgi:transcriptional regulator with XRE-family HTH domain
MNADRAAIAGSVATACTESAGTVQALAEEVGVSYAALCSWSRGRRRPPPHRLLKLAEVLDTRAERLRELADELRQLAGQAPMAADGAGVAAPDARPIAAVRAPAASPSALPLAASPSRGDTAAGAGRPGRAWADPARQRAQPTRPGGIPLPPAAGR